jgi:uncharacterized OB-fold protein
MTPPTFPAAPDINANYWQNIANGQLSFSRCARCGHGWLPVSRECPACLAADWTFEPASGEAIALSWVTFHHSYNELWADRLPYVVALIQLAEGPRLMTNLVAGSDPSRLRMDHPVLLVIEEERGIAVPRFKPVDLVTEGKAAP